MRLGGPAKFLCIIRSEDDLIEAVAFADSKNLTIKVVGSGSNLAWPVKGYDGLVVVNRIEHFSADTDITSIGAGMNWDDVVARTVSSGLSGIEFLSLIPGTAGATPVQNVGAYGAEIKDVLISLKAFDLTNKQFVVVKNSECDFSYRKSRFNTYDSGRFIITEITLQLSSGAPKPPFYRALQEYMYKNQIDTISPQAIRNAVIAIRESKLPDPEVHANNGSYFANPIITKQQYAALQQKFSGIVGWEYGTQIKMPAAWLIDQAGFRDYKDEKTGMATWHKHPLILINESAKSTEDLIRFRDKIINSVEEKFDITLQPEPEIVEQ